MQESVTEEQWQAVCEASEIPPFLGVRALVGDQQVAIFRVGKSLYAINALDPFSKAAVLSRGLVGDMGQQLVVASPVYKHHFNLDTGVCLEDETVRVETYPIREADGKVEVAPYRLPQHETHSQPAVAAAG